MSWSYGMSRSNRVICSFLINKWQLFLLKAEKNKWIQHTFLWMNEFHPGVRLFLTFSQIQMIHCPIAFSRYMSQHPQFTKYWEFQKQASQDFYCRKAAWIIHSNLNKISNVNLWLLLFIRCLTLGRALLKPASYHILRSDLIYSWWQSPWTNWWMHGSPSLPENSSYNYQSVQLSI